MNRICFIGFSLAFVLSCAEFERINPCDSGGAKSDPQACAEAGSSSVAEPSSSSAAASSSSVATSSSSVALSSSSSSVGLCSGFVNGTEREHYGISKHQFCDSRDGKKYVYVTIGEQIWMAENLNYDANGSKCYGDNTGGDSQSKCDTYGRLYNWATAMNNSASSTADPSGIRGVCPAGWHLPSQAEWEVLKTYVQNDKGCTNCDAKHLKAASGWNGNGNGLDSYGFSALPLVCGVSGSCGSFAEGYYGSFWWSASEHNNSLSAYLQYMDPIYDSTTWQYDKKSGLFSVRCLQD